MLQAPANAEGASRFGGVMDAVKSWIYGQPAQPTEAPEPEKKENPKDPKLTTEQNSKSAPAPPPPQRRPSPTAAKPPLNLIDRENPYTDIMKTVDKKAKKTDKAVKEALPDETESAIN